MPLRLRDAILAAALVVALSACGAERPAELIDSAKRYVAAGNDKAAIIQLRNAVQQDPKQAEARYLLGTTLARMGDYATAEKELRRALEYGYPSGQVYPALADVLLRSGQADALAGELGDKDLSDGAAQARLKTTLGFAHLARGDLGAARAAFQRALAAQPDDPSARAGLARIQAARGDLPGAERAVDDILARHPDTIEVLLLKVDLLAAQGRVRDTLPVLERVLQIDPHNGQAWTLAVANLVETGELDRARERLDAMAKALPGDLRVRYLEGLLAFRRNEPAKARDAIQQVLRVAPDHLPSLFLAGAVDYELGAYALAEDRMRKVLARDPANPSARQVLVATYLRTGQAARAEEALEPALRASPDDPKLLRLAGEVAMAGGEVDRAVRYYDRAAQGDQGSAELRSRLAVARFASGEVDRGVKDLEAASRMDPQRYQADLALVAVLLSQGRNDQALVAAEGLRKKQPDNPLTYNVIGTVRRAQGDASGARESFEQSLKLMPTYLPALRNLAAMDLVDRRPEAARARFDAAVAKNPGREDLLLALAELQTATRAPASEVAGTLDRAVSANPKSASARVALVRYRLGRGEAREALAAAQAAQAALPDDAAVLDVLGQAQLANGEASQAVQTYTRLTSVAPQAPASYLRLAQAQLASRDAERGIQSLRKALELRPGLVEAERPLVMTLVAAGRPEEALAEVRNLQRARPHEAVGYALEGDTLMALKRYDGALAAYREALQRQRSPQTVIALYQAAEAAGKGAEGERAVQTWMRERPNAIEVPMFLAGRDMARNDYRAATRRYAEILKTQPDNVVALNNYAWALEQLKDPQALNYAERAYRLAPNNPAVADTYGGMLAARGEGRRALEILGAAAQAAPRSGDIRLHYARALLSNGDKAAARRELEAVARVGTADQRTEAQGLLAQL